MQNQENKNTPQPGQSLAQLLLSTQQLESAIVLHAETNFGEINEQLEAALAQIDTQLADKIDSYKHVMDRLQMNAQLYDAQAEEIGRVAASFQSAYERIKDRIKYVMGSTGRTELVGSTWKFKCATLKPRVLIDETSLPEEFKCEVVLKKPDKEKIQAALERGETISGVQLEPSFRFTTSVNKVK